jgi:hypothetical protein
MLGFAALGALIAAGYGVLHDQVTYTISPEYFTRLKFRQFAYADFGWPLRVYVAEIGALATWWVGFAAGWFMARTVLPRSGESPALPLIVRGFMIMLTSAFLFGVGGYCLGLAGGITPENSGIAAYGADLGVADLPAFVRVAYIHNAGYLGGLIGLIAAVVWLRRRLTAPVE